MFDYLHAFGTPHDQPPQVPRRRAVGAGHTFNHELRRWEPPLADRHYKAAKRKMRAHKAWVKENNALCHWVSYPFGKVDIEAICTLKWAYS